jgi:hypothetical protein
MSTPLLTPAAKDRMLRWTLFNGLLIFARIASVAQSPQAVYRFEVQGFFDQAGNPVAAPRSWPIFAKSQSHCHGLRGSM